MPPKKKKTQLKPVARGFATTSVPKKVAPAEEERLPIADSPAGTTSKPTATSKSQQPGPADATSTVKAVDPERQASQLFLEKYQERVEKDIASTNFVLIPVLQGSNFQSSIRANELRRSTPSHVWGPCMLSPIEGNINSWLGRRLRLQSFSIDCFLRLSMSQGRL